MSSASFFEPIPQINVQELAVKLQESPESLQLIDVREPQEIAIASIPNFVILPLSQFEQWSPQITTQFQPDVETLVICHHGVRSEQMCYWLRQTGFTNVKNIIGGIDAYSLIIDRTIPRY